QRVAVDAQHLGGMGLVAAHPDEHALQERLLDAVADHVVDGALLLPVEVAKIAVDRLAHHARHFVLVHHSAGSSTYVRRRPLSASCAKKISTACSCSARVSSW